NGTVITNRFGVGYPDMDYYKIYHRGGLSDMLISRYWNMVEVGYDFNHSNAGGVAMPSSFRWDITATNSMMPSNTRGLPHTTISPNEGVRFVEVGIRAENECGCSPWRWEVFGVSRTNQLGKL
ncbi:MAG: hypothetical protein Q4G08_09950, partial [Capnocytophaga sp.]|nr:hypothetical protein [Capnocytophaga sp.]